MTLDRKAQFLENGKATFRVADIVFTIDDPDLVKDARSNRNFLIHNVTEMKLPSMSGGTLARREGRDRYVENYEYIVGEISRIVPEGRYTFSNLSDRQKTPQVRVTYGVKPETLFDDFDEACRKIRRAMAAGRQRSMT